ncbi:hypothetical protein DL93DRAFT_765102 [Clavulina sp. PMI_390]|nr:hypothetical protein DL93DRAFT_765102 [Clavulina sp. PMI_390]
MLWHRFAERCFLPPLRPEFYTQRLEDARGLPPAGKTIMLQSPQSETTLNPQGPSIDSARSRMQRIFGAQHRLHARGHSIRALEINSPIVNLPAHEYIAVAITTEGEVLVVWTVSGLLVVDLHHETRLQLRFRHETVHRPESPKLVTSMCEYNGSVGILIAGNLM